MSVCPSVRPSVRPSSFLRPSEIFFQFLQSFIIFRVPDAQLDHCRRGEAEVRILDFKTTWSESQKVSQTVTE